MSGVKIEAPEGNQKKSITYSRMSTAARINPQSLIYDVYRCPASLEEAEMHRRATTFAVPVPDSDKICPCCKHVAEVKEFSLFGNTNTVSDVCPTVGVYFYFLGFSIFLQFLIFCFNSIVLLVQNPQFRECFLTNCPEDTEAMVDLYQNSGTTRILTCVCLGLMITLRHGFYYFVRDIYKEAGQTRVSADDFSILLHVPEYKTEVQIKEDLDKVFLKRNINCSILNINKIYDLRKYIELINTVTERDQTLRRMKHVGTDNTIPYRKCMDAKGFAVESLELLINRLQTLEGEVQNFANLAFVTFKSNYECMTIRMLLKKKFVFKRTRAREYWAEEADEPENYLWENFGTKIDKKVSMRLLALFSTLICWAVTFTILTLFKYGVGRIDGLKNLPPILVNFGCYIIITVMHIIVGNVMGFFTKKEQFIRLSDQLTSSAWKGFLVAFVNTAISIVVSSWVNSGKGMVEAIWKGGGMAPTTMLVMTFDVIYNNFMALFNFDFVKGLFVRRAITLTAQKEGKSNKIMQIDLNKAYENSEFGVSGHYTTIFYVLSMVFFYQQVVPYAPVIGIGTLIIKYIVTRYLLFYRSLKPKNFSFDFTQHMFLMLDFCFLIYGSSTAFFQAVFQAYAGWYKTIIVAMGLVNFLYGVISLYTSTGQTETLGQELRFEEQYQKLESDYDRVNPITSSKALQKWLASIDLNKADPKTLRAVRLSMAVKPNASKFGPVTGNRVQVESKFAAKPKPALPGNINKKLDYDMREKSDEQEGTMRGAAVAARTVKSSQAPDKNPLSMQKSKSAIQSENDLGETKVLNNDFYYSSV